ncbi:GGDEF domain-containing protein [Vibrio ziniensis]|uniref:diguanylate cyclase n=1 Tax=Vibrio ziniensis TaxID=2711221 RepID=A0A6G7CJD6_9VIBR|nr:diguanylate cyclase [Vibrio ziniensis]QIH42158.1 diguanylate cyclase [Vibrio ziniensis]
MKPKKNYKKVVIFVPLALVIAVIAVMAYSYLIVLNQQIRTEYRNVNIMLQRAGKILVALDYGFTSYYETSLTASADFNIEVVDGVCQLSPKESSILTQNLAHSSPPINISYMMVGDEKYCNVTSDVTELALRKVTLAPIISFLHDLDDYVIGVHYLDDHGFIISSPKEAIQGITQEQLNTIRLKTFWQEAAQNPDVISVIGPSAFSEVLMQRNNMTLAMPVFENKEFQGVVVLDVSVDKLIGDLSPVAGKLRLVRSESLPLDRSVYLPHKLNVSYTNMDHYLYYHWDWKNELSQFVSDMSMGITVVLLAYLVTVIGALHLGTRVEKNYYENLASHDPMTGVLNRRGMEEFLKGKEHNTYLSISVFDIDNFKSINDTYGHDIGDNVICYLGEQIEKSIRSTDAVARFGGEEFVIYLTGDDRDVLKKIMLRVKDAITEKSSSVVERGFTVSGGVEIIESAEGCDFDKLFKIADEKLYEAKTTGKNKLVF